MAATAEDRPLPIVDTMILTSTTIELFVVAIQDLYAAEKLWIERIESLSERAGTDLKTFLTDERARSNAQALRLSELLDILGAAQDGAPNIWLRAILDDADRDAASIEGGPLRDIALCGAFRKGKQSERVSYETAMYLACRLDDSQAHDILTRCRDEEAQADDWLDHLLGATIDRV